MSLDSSVLDDPAAEEAYVYLQRARTLTADELAATSGSLTPREAGAGLRALKEGGFASSEDDETFTLTDPNDPPRLVGVPVPDDDAEPQRTAEARPEEQPSPVSLPPAPSGLDPSVLVDIARGEKVRLRITGWAELIEGGEFRVVEIEEVLDARRPGEGPIRG